MQRRTLGCVFLIFGFLAQFAGKYLIDQPTAGSSLTMTHPGSGQAFYFISRLCTLDDRFFYFRFGNILAAADYFVVIVHFNVILNLFNYLTCSQSSLFNDVYPFGEQKLHPADQQRNPAHNRVAEGSPEADHNEPDADIGGNF